MGPDSEATVPAMWSFPRRGAAGEPGAAVADAVLVAALVVVVVDDDVLFDDVPQAATIATATMTGPAVMRRGQPDRVCAIATLQSKLVFRPSPRYLGYTFECAQEPLEEG